MTTCCNKNGNGCNPCMTKQCNNNLLLRLMNDMLTEEDYQNQIDDINTELTTVQDNIENLNIEVSDLNNTIQDLSGRSFFTAAITDELPTEGTENVLYFVRNTNSTETDNLYDEYMWLSDVTRFEKISGTGYVLASEFQTFKVATGAAMETINSRVDDLLSRVIALEQA